ncbi:MAG: leucine--tRNA ligase [Candidatus Micrarchaeota archaeon]
MDFQEMERKWQAKWEEKRAFRADSSDKKKFYLTAAFPYPNSPQHIGHARTYTTTDVYARFMRMNGFNVLFPMAFHVTGTPILGMAKRIKDKDGEILRIFDEIYHIKREVSASLTDPVALVTHFSKEIEMGMREMGFSIDWRRKFYTYDKAFNSFVGWQFKKLNALGYITKGSHPVPWCPKCNNAIGSHDTRGDVDPELGEYIVIKFKYGEGYLLTATFRPETLYGVTNLWINPEVTYVKVKMDGDVYYISREASEKFKIQGHDVEIVGEVSGKEITGSCINPINGKEIPLLSASFVDPKNGSGIVMSVPAHAPYDYMALKDIGSDVRLIQVLKLDGFGEFPAKEICERMGIKNQNDTKLEAATKEIYRKEAHTGIMVLGKYGGELGISAKEKIWGDLLESSDALAMHEIINGPIYCRCGSFCIVRTVGNQWFIDYGNKRWKDVVKECFGMMSIIPEKTKAEYLYVIDWLRQKACTRASGLGTIFPFDEEQIIEPLSDSTVYMAFYTIAHLLDRDVALSEEDYDYIFLGKGEGNAKLDELRKEFSYWYPLDSRHSAGDLVHNHLTFLIFNHVAIFPREKWPKQIVTNGFVLMEGGKMSKSMGNIMPLKDAIGEYGADIVRFCVVSGAELSQDSDFNQAMADGVASRLRFMFRKLKNAKKTGGLSGADRWLLSRLHRRVNRVNSAFSALELRTIAQELLYNTVNDIRWHEKRGDGEVPFEYFECWVPLIAPFTPHVAEEMWEMIGKEGLVSLSKFPKADESRIDDAVEDAEEIIVKTREDIEHVLSITGIKPKHVYLYVAGDWKRKLRSIAFKEKRFDKAMKVAMSDDEMKGIGKDVARVLQSFIKNVNELSENVVGEGGETEALEGAIEYFRSEFNSEFTISTDSAAPETHSKKAKGAMPLKPAIYIE